MNPLAKRILIHGLLTAGILALVGMMFAEIAGMWMTANTGGVRPGSEDLNPPVEEKLRYRIPLTMAIGGFLFIAVAEIIAERIRRRRPPAQPTQPQPDETERLLNELLAQAEAKAAAEAAAKSAETGVSNQESGVSSQQSETPSEPRA